MSVTNTSNPLISVWTGNSSAASKSNKRIRDDGETIINWIHSQFQSTAKRFNWSSADLSFPLQKRNKSEDDSSSSNSENHVEQPFMLTEAASAVVKSKNVLSPIDMNSNTAPALQQTNTPKSPAVKSSLPSTRNKNKANNASAAAANADKENNNDENSTEIVSVEDVNTIIIDENDEKPISAATAPVRSTRTRHGGRGKLPTAKHEKINAQESVATTEEENSESARSSTDASQTSEITGSAAAAKKRGRKVKQQPAQSASEQETSEDNNDGISADSTLTEEQEQAKQAKTKGGRGKGKKAAKATTGTATATRSTRARAKAAVTTTDPAAAESITIVEEAQPSIDADAQKSEDAPCAREEEEVVESAKTIETAEVSLLASDVAVEITSSPSNVAVEIETQVKSTTVDNESTAIISKPETTTESVINQPADVPATNELSQSAASMESALTPASAINEEIPPIQSLPVSETSLPSIDESSCSVLSRTTSSTTFTAKQYVENLKAKANMKQFKGSLPSTPVANNVVSLDNNSSIAEKIKAFESNNHDNTPAASTPSMSVTSADKKAGFLSRLNPFANWGKSKEQTNGNTPSAALPASLISTPITEPAASIKAVLAPALVHSSPAEAANGISSTAAVEQPKEKKDHLASLKAKALASQQQQSAALDAAKKLISNNTVPSSRSSTASNSSITSQSSLRSSVETAPTIINEIQSVAASPSTASENTITPISAALKADWPLSPIQSPLPAHKSSSSHNAERVEPMSSLEEEQSCDTTMPDDLPLSQSSLAASENSQTSRFSLSVSSTISSSYPASSSVTKSAADIENKLQKAKLMKEQLDQQKKDKIAESHRKREEAEKRRRQLEEETLKKHELQLAATKQKQEELELKKKREEMLRKQKAMEEEKAKSLATITATMTAKGKPEAAASQQQMTTKEKPQTIKKVEDKKMTMDTNTSGVLAAHAETSAAVDTATVPVTTAVISTSVTTPSTAASIASTPTAATTAPVRQQQTPPVLLPPPNLFASTANAMQQTNLTPSSSYSTSSIMSTHIALSNSAPIPSTSSTPSILSSHTATQSITIGTPGKQMIRIHTAAGSPATHLLSNSTAKAAHDTLMSPPPARPPPLSLKPGLQHASFPQTFATTAAPLPSAQPFLSTHHTHTTAASSSSSTSHHLLPPKTPESQKITNYTSMSIPPTPGILVMGDERNYEMSDHDDEESDVSDDEDQQQKRVPDWAQGSSLQAALERQAGANTDPDTIFEPLDPHAVDLNSIFRNFRKKKRFRDRTSSGNWLNDRLSMREELNYKRQMGYIRH